MSKGKGGGGGGMTSGEHEETFPSFIGAAIEFFTWSSRIVPSHAENRNGHFA